jgi:glycosyltransferase involved in cell wall biosynthesis
MRFVERVVVVSAQQQQELQRRFTRPETLLVLNGTPSRPLPVRTINKGPLRLLMVARLTPEKNHALALDVMQHLLRQHIPVTLKVIGDGPLYAALQRNIDEKGLSGHVELMGFQNNPLPFFAEADLTLITSTTEGLPMTLLESLSCAVPVISTPVGQIPAVINQGQCGRIVVGNVDAFVDALSACHHHRDSLLIWGQNGHQLIAEHYSVQQQAEHLHHIYLAVSS